MRSTITSFVVLLVLMWGAAAMAGHHEAGEGTATEMSSIEMNPPENTDFATPAARLTSAEGVPVEGTDLTADE